MTYPDNVRVLLEPLSARCNIDNLAPDPRLGVLPNGGLSPPAIVHGGLQVIVLGGVVPLPLARGAWGGGSAGGIKGTAYLPAPPPSPCTSVDCLAVHPVYMRMSGREAGAPVGRVAAS